MNSRKLFASLASAAMVLSLAGCGGGSGGSSDGGQPQTLIVGNTQELSGVFSPLYYQSSYDGWICNLIYNSLLEYTADSELVPDLAAEMPEVSDDGSTVTFKMKEGIKFSDGTDCNANDVKFTFTLLADPSYDGRFQTNVNFIEGFEEYNSGDAEELTGIEVVDDYTLIFHIATPQIDAVSTIGGQDILSDEQYEYTKGNLGEYQSQTDKPIGTNAYVLNSYEKATGASLVRNENYTGDGEYKIDRVIYKTIATGTELKALESGDINYFPTSIEANIIGPASLNEDLTFDYYFRPAEGFFGFNCQEGATADQAVRQALAYATNREEFGQAYFKFPEASEELADVHLGYVPAVYWNPVSYDLGEYVTGQESLEGLETYEYDLDKARQILEDAGWKEGKNGIREKDGQKLEVKFLASEGNSVLEMLIPMITKSWKEIGVDLKQTTVDFNTLLETVTPSTNADENKGDWNVFFMATSYTGVSNADANVNYKSGDPNNYPQIESKELDKLLAAGKDTMDEEVSVDNYKKAMILANDLVPYFPIYGNELFNIYAKNIKGMNTGPVRDWSQALDTAYIEQ